MEKIRSLVGMVSKKKFFSACKCYENNKYGVDYVKPQLCIDEESHLIFCDRCGAVIDPFAAMLMVAIFEKGKTVNGVDTWKVLDGFGK